MMSALNYFQIQPQKAAAIFSAADGALLGDGYVLLLQVIWGYEHFLLKVIMYNCIFGFIKNYAYINLNNFLISYWLNVSLRRNAVISSVWR